MVSFKLCISDPHSGRTYQREVKDNQARAFLGLNIGEALKGDSFDFSGYEFLITGGSDYCGFPMRKGILGARKKIAIYGGVGFRGNVKGIRKRKTVCGHKIHERISQINLKVLEQGSKKLGEIFGVAEESRIESKQAAKEEKTVAKVEKKEIEKTKEEVKERKEAKKETKKAEEKKDEKKD